jgi:predicted transcriptional regulator
MADPTKGMTSKTKKAVRDIQTLAGDKLKRGNPLIGKIDRVKLAEMLSRGISQAECAKHFGCSGAAISKAAKENRGAVACSAALEAAPKILEREIKIGDEAKQLYSRALSLLDEVENDNDDALIRLKALAECRMQLAGIADLMARSISIESVRDHQRIILEEIKKESPETIERILTRLRKAKLLRQSVTPKGN